MATGSEGVVGAAGIEGVFVSDAQVNRAARAAAGSRGAGLLHGGGGPLLRGFGGGGPNGSHRFHGLHRLHAAHRPQAQSGQGAQFVYAAATVANVLCDNLTQTQINLLANFLSVVTTCVYAILTVENPTDVLEA